MVEFNAGAIIVLSIIGLCCGLFIYLANRFLPKEPADLKRAEEIAELLPGMNCGACGMPGCFAYAQAVAKDTGVMALNPCMTMMKNEAALEKLGECLGCDLRGLGSAKEAVIHCSGYSEVIYEYEGVQTCKAAAQLAGGYKRCPFGCIGLGDCAKVCPEGAITIDPELNIAVVNHTLCIGCGLCVSECPNNLIEIVPGAVPQYLGCSYTPKQNIAGREKCKVGCIHCGICNRTTPDALDWNEKLGMPRFVEKSADATESIRKCPVGIIIPLGNKDHDLRAGVRQKQRTKMGLEEAPPKPVKPAEQDER